MHAPSEAQNRLPSFDRHFQPHYLAHAMQALRNYINQQTRATISDADFALITAELLPFKLRRKQFLLRAGDVCRYKAFCCRRGRFASSLPLC